MTLLFETRRPFARALSFGAVPAVIAGLMLLAAVPASAQRDSQGVEPVPRQRTPVEPRERQGGDKAGPKSGQDAGKQAAEPKPIPSRIRRPGATAVPEGGGERAKLLDELYAHLATAPDEQIGARVATAIEHVWQSSGSDTVNLLMERAGRAAGEKKHELAIRLLEQAARLAPDDPEVFHRRAAVQFAHNNVHAAIGDLRRVLALEPNHYKALEALGQIFKELGRKKAALEFYRRLYEIHPTMSGAKTTLDELEREIDGQSG